jgi:hypothetical protein
MDLSKILTIAGKGGLYSVVSQSKNGFIVESLTDGKKIPVFASNQSSSLEDISVFTKAEDIPLKQVLWKIYQKEDGQPAIDTKIASNQQLRDYFREVLPEFDEERVYNSDIKKVIAWYNLLVQKDLISDPNLEEQADESSEEQTQNPEEQETSEGASEEKSE